MANTASHQQTPQDGARMANEPAYEGVAANALPLTASEDRQWAMLAHCGGVLLAVPALLIYLIFRDRGPFTAQESKEALNFTLPPTVLALMALALSLIPVIGGVFAIIHALIWLTVTVFSVRAAVQVNRGRPYRYRFNLRLIP